MISAVAREESLPPELQIQSVERRLFEHRQRIGSAAARIRSRVRMGPTGMIAAAVGFGVFLHQSRDRRAWSFMTLLNGVYTSGSLVMTLASWISPARKTSVSTETHPSQ